jgi:hypothetical protein
VIPGTYRFSTFLLVANVLILIGIGDLDEISSIMLNSNRFVALVLNESSSPDLWQSSGSRSVS